MKALSGGPSQFISFKRTNYSNFGLFSYIWNANSWGFFHSVGNDPSDDGKGDDQVNDCGITYRHSFSILSLIQIYENGGSSGNVIANLYLIKDPRAELAISNYNGPWSTNDT